jgi:hypothetical protein
MNNQTILYNDEKYEELINIYNNELSKIDNELLKTNNDELSKIDNELINKILFNRCLCFLKLKQYNNAFNDALKLVKKHDTSFKAWGYLGASLYGLNKLEQSIVAYNKANDLFNINNKLSNNQNIYQKMIDEIIEKQNNFASQKTNTTDELNKKILKNINNSNMKGLFNSLYNTILYNPTVIDKLSNADFQKKLLNLHNKPEEALKDKEISGILENLIENINL